MDKFEGPNFSSATDIKPMSNKSSLAEQKKKTNASCFFEDSKVDTDKKRKTAKQSETDTEKKKNFELNGHKFFLTYSGLTEKEASNEEMLSFVRELTICNGLVEYSIGTEEHPNPDNEERKWHLHVYFCTEKKKKVKNPAKHFMWKEFKGDYQAVGSKKSFSGVPPAEQRKYVIDYTMKEGNYIQQLNATDANKADQDIEARVMNATSKQEGLEMYAESDPKGFMKGFNNINAALNWKFETKKEPLKFDIYDFRRDQEALNFNKSPCWVVHGDADTGKTQWVKACLEAAGYKRPLTVSTISGLKKFQKNVHDSIIMEECNFKDANITSKDGTEKKNQNQMDFDGVKNLLEFEEDREVTDQGRLPASIPAGVPKVFITNKTDGDIFPQGGNEQDQKAINRRFKRVEILSSLYPYEKNDRQLREEEQFSELCARKTTRNIMRNIRKDAREGNLTLGPRTELHDQFDQAAKKYKEESKKIKEREEAEKITMPNMLNFVTQPPIKKQRIDTFKSHKGYTTKDLNMLTAAA